MPERAFLILLLAPILCSALAAVWTHVASGTERPILFPPARLARTVYAGSMYWLGSTTLIGSRLALLLSAHLAIQVAVFFVVFATGAAAMRWTTDRLPQNLANWIGA